MHAGLQRGTSLAELMVGALVALIAVLAILRTFSAAEGMKRNATGVGDAQQVGLLALSTVSSEIASAGSGIASAAAELGTCPDTGDIRTTLRPISVLITPGAGQTVPDAIVVNHAADSAHGAAVPFAADAPAMSAYRVRSPFGLAANDLITAISLTGRCALTTATAVSAPDGDGIVEIAHSGAPDSYPASSRLLDLGQRGRATRARFDVSDATLRSLDLLTTGAVANPIASDIVNFKAQYGVDSDGDGNVDTWVGADTAPWTPAGVLAASVAALGRIKAVRVGLIVKSETADRNVVRPFDWVLFDCAAADKAQCPGRLTGTLPAGSRYRVYETAIPLRNVIWNAAP
jgi:type IV pilus assembly protein PilW